MTRPATTAKRLTFQHVTVEKRSKKLALYIDLRVSIWKTQACQCPCPPRLGTTCGQTSCWVISLGPHTSHKASASSLDPPCRMAARENRGACWSVGRCRLAGSAEHWLCFLTPAPDNGGKQSKSILLETACPHREAGCQMGRQTPKLWHLCLGVFQLKVPFCFNS